MKTLSYFHFLICYFLFLLTVLFSSDYSSIASTSIGNQEDSLKTVQFINKNQDPADYHLKHEDSFLQDTKTKELIPNNEVTLSLGESLLIECHLSTWVLMYRYRLVNTVGDTSSLYLENQASEKKYGANTWWNTSTYGPFFLFTAQELGTTSFDIECSVADRFAVGAGIPQSCEHPYTFFGHVIVHVIDQP